MKRWIKYEKINYYYLFFQYRNYLLLYSFLQHVEHITGTRRINAIGHTCGSAGKQSACNAGDLSSTPGLGRSPGEGNDSSTLAWRIPWTEWLSLTEPTTTSDFPEENQEVWSEITSFVQTNTADAGRTGITPGGLCKSTTHSPDRPAQHLACTRTALLG